jgi:hypothetical protein
MSAAPKMNFNVQDLILPQYRSAVDLLINVSPMTFSHLNSNTIYVSEKESPEFLMRMANEKAANHLVQTSAPNFERTLNSSARMIFEPSNFKKQPLLNIFNPGSFDQNVENKLCIYEKYFSAATEKKSVLQELDDKLAEKKASGSLRSELLVVADELFTNAVFNAPFADREAADGPKVSRERTDVQMDQGKQGRLFVGCDDQSVAICCFDPYGSLVITKLLDRIRSCFMNGVSRSMNMGATGGAGIGSYMVYGSSTDYFLVVDPGECTMICSVTPLKMSSRARQELPKSVHILDMTRVCEIRACLHLTGPPSKNQFKGSQGARRKG